MRSLVPWRSKHGDMESAGDGREMRRQMEHFMERVFRDPLGLMHDDWEAFGEWRPAADIVEDDKQITVRMEVPGVDPKDLDISISGSVLTVAGEKCHSSEQREESWHQTERCFGRFRRMIQLPGEVDADKVSAEHANGVLTVRIPRAAAARGKRIPVQVA